ncbi:MAG: hypothetical protein WCC08_07820 [Terrimicrobiaceae bacterium]
MGTTKRYQTLIHDIGPGDTPEPVIAIGFPADFLLGLAGFAGTYGASALVGRHLFSLLCGLPMALAVVTIGLLAVGHSLWSVAAMMVVWGTLNSAIPVAWSTWLSKGIRDEPESGGGLMVGTIQLAIMLGAGFGGLLLDHLSIAATFIGSAVLLAIASVAVGGAYPPRD